MTKLEILHQSREALGSSASQITQLLQATSDAAEVKKLLSRNLQIFNRVTEIQMMEALEADDLYEKSYDETREVDVELRQKVQELADSIATAQTITKCIGILDQIIALAVKLIV